MSSSIQTYLVRSIVANDANSYATLESSFLDSSMIQSSEKHEIVFKNLAYWLTASIIVLQVWLAIDTIFSSYASWIRIPRGLQATIVIVPLVSHWIALKYLETSFKVFSISGQICYLVLAILILVLSYSLLTFVSQVTIDETHPDFIRSRQNVREK